MRAGMQVAGTSIDRVFNQPIVPARKFRGAIDAALTLALGSVCAFGLTLGPAPMNTVALSAPIASSLGGTLDPEPGTVLAPNDLNDDDVDSAGSGEDAPGESFRPRLPETADSTESSPVPPAAEGSAPGQPRPQPVRPTHPLGKPPQGAQPPQKSQHPQHPSPAAPRDNAAGPQFMVQSTALSVVENYRIASGLGGFVAASECAQPVVHSVVVVNPSLSLPTGLAKKALAPDPAYATVSDGPGALDVTIYTCN